MSTRRQIVTGLILGLMLVQPAYAADADVRRTIDRALKYLADAQTRNGRWEADGGAYPVAMTALAGMALLMDGNTTFQGPFAPNVRAAVDYLLDQAQPNGLIGHPQLDSRYMYGHGFSMLFLSQVLGEEEEPRQRQRLAEVLEHAVVFCGQAQTKDGGWGYVSSHDGSGFDEGSVTITQMQGLRGCRNAGVPVPASIIAKGVDYIKRCTNDEDGGVRYSLKTAGESRPPITAAAVACLFSGGDYANPGIAKMIQFSEKNLAPDDEHGGSYGHWHYAHYYFAQVMYRVGEPRWLAYRDKVFKMLVQTQAADGSWSEGFVGPVYTTALNLAILQLENESVPIYQR